MRWKKRGEEEQRIKITFYRSLQSFLASLEKRVRKMVSHSCQSSAEGVTGIVGKKFQMLQQLLRKQTCIFLDKNLPTCKLIFCSFSARGRILVLVRTIRHCRFRFINGVGSCLRISRLHSQTTQKRGISIRYATESDNSKASYHQFISSYWQK